MTPKPNFGTGDHVTTSSGKTATVIKPSVYRHHQWEYFIRIDNGPKIKETESNLETAETSDIIEPIVTDLIGESVKIAERRKLERRKSEFGGAGWAYELQPVDVKPAKAFTIQDKEYRCLVSECDKNFRKKSGLDAHMKHYHPDVKTYDINSPIPGMVTILVNLYKQKQNLRKNFFLTSLFLQIFESFRISQSVTHL